MSTILVANVFFESTQNNAIQYVGSGTLNFRAGGNNVFVANSSGLFTSGSVLSGSNTNLISKGFTLAPAGLGTMSSFTINPALGNYQYGTNNSAITLTAPTIDSAITLLITNGATAGAITFSGFTVGTLTGDALTITNGSKFLVSITRINTISTYIIKALQ